MENWWDVIREISILANDGDYFPSDSQTKKLLLKRGFSEVNIDFALEWIDEQKYLGSLEDVMSMLKPKLHWFRSKNPLEAVTIDEGVYRRLENARRKGLVPFDLCERIIEGLRQFDPRDMDGDEVYRLIFSIVDHYGITNAQRKQLKEVVFKLLENEHLYYN